MEFGFGDGIEKLFLNMVKTIKQNQILWMMDETPVCAWLAHGGRFLCSISEQQHQFGRVPLSYSFLFSPLRKEMN